MSGDLKRWFQYDPKSLEPVMCVAPKRDRTLDRAVFLVPLHKAYLLVDPIHIRQVAWFIANRFDLGLLTIERFSSIRSFLEDGLDELLAMKPAEAMFDERPKVIGEGEIWVGSNKTSFEITDEMARDVEQLAGETLH